MPLYGVLALALAFVFATIGLLLYGPDDMGPNLLAGLFELCAGVGIAILVIDRANRLQTRKGWARGYAAINGLLAASFVDIMRLLSVRRDDPAYLANHARYSEFVDIALLHLNSLRSSLEGFASVLEPQSHLLIRSAELRMSWLLNRIRLDPGGPKPDDDDRKRLSEIAADIAQVLKLQGDPRYTGASRASRGIVDHLRSSPSVDGAVSDVLALRLQAQSELLSNLGFSSLSERYIIDDVDNELAIAYFALDHELIKAATPPE